MPCIHVYLGYKCQTQDGCCADEETQTEKSGIDVEIILERVERYYDYSCDNTCHINSESNTLGVIEALDFDLAYRERKCKSKHLQECFVAIEDPQTDISASGITKEEVVFMYYPPHLYNIIR
jgi:hypothetical protein